MVKEECSTCVCVCIYAYMCVKCPPFPVTFQKVKGVGLDLR